MKSIALYSPCASCDGHGRISISTDGPRTSLCRKCRGKGFGPSEEGREIICLAKVAKMEGLLPNEGV